MIGNLNKMKSLEDRLWTKVNKTAECWEWTAGRNTDGYGSFRINGAMAGAHRVIYELLNGEIPEGLELDHLCRNKICVNPYHLEPVTHKENVLRGDGLAARESRQMYCIHGHSLSGANLYIAPGGIKRSCRKCTKQTHKRYVERKRK